MPWCLKEFTVKAFEQSLIESQGTRVPRNFSKERNCLEVQVSQFRRVDVLTEERVAIACCENDEIAPLATIRMLVNTGPLGNA